MNDLHLKTWQLAGCAILSFFVVSLGQPAWIPTLGIFASSLGYALFWRALLAMPRKKHRFWAASAWFSAVQLFQLSWAASHPYAYIYGVWLVYSFAIGLQFGLLSLLLNPNSIRKIPSLFLIASVWTLFEWARLFFLSGYTWNPSGLALAGNLYSLQFASLAGVFGMSFLVILTNLAAVRAWVSGFTINTAFLWLFLTITPYLFGAAHLAYHSSRMAEHTNQAKVLLVQTAFPVEESLKFTSMEHYLKFIFSEWKQIIEITRPHYGKPVDLVVLPELVVPFGTYTLIYPYEEVKAAFMEVFGPESENALPPLDLPLASPKTFEKNSRRMVNNAYWAQTLSNLFNAGVVIGLEDAEDIQGERHYLSSAQFFTPMKPRMPPEIKRYAKRVLVPMGEYIPFSFCRDIARQYGVLGSFTCGTKPEVWEHSNASFGISICYEEMFGCLMRENKLMGANLLLNITSDAWFPHSKLTRQHLEHSRLRAVENGFPLVRACNTGITCVVDALGRDTAILGEDSPSREDLADALYAGANLYNYQTIYTLLGDNLIIGISILSILVYVLLKFKTGLPESRRFL